MSDISILDGPFILPHLDKMQHEDERSGTPYFAIPLPSVTLRTEPASLGFLCSFLLLLLSPVFGPCSVERVCPTLLLCSFQPQAPPKHIIINRDVWLLCISSLLLNYVISNESIHIPFFFIGVLGLSRYQQWVTQACGSSPRQRQTCKGRVPGPELQGRFVKLLFFQNHRITESQYHRMLRVGRDL